MKLVPKFFTVLKSTRQSSGNNFSDNLRGFGPIGIISILIILFTGNIVLPGMIVVPIGALLVLLWVLLSDIPWSNIGYAKPKNWIMTVAIGLALGIFFKLLMKAIVMPLFGAEPINQSYHFLAGNKALLPAAIFAMLIAGFGEETVFRGYMFERFGKLFGPGVNSTILIVLITSALFASSHYYTQGIPGVQQAAVMGVVYGIIYSVTNSIWMVMITHSAFNLTALAIIYWNLETDVAHIIFK
jgi:membrane protease YdiL (CAAX protease family)